MKRVFLKKGRKKNVLLRHPWIFSGAIDKMDLNVRPGDVVEVCDHSGNVIAKGYINPKSQITIRIMTWQKDENPEDKNFIINRLRSAIELRMGHFDPSKTNAFRLINSEADFMPGLIVDKYNDIIVIQILTLGIERFRKVIVEFLREYLSPKCIYERSDMPVRKKEGLDLKKGPVYGSPITKQEILENGYNFLVDIQEGQKTGFYLDQRDNRKELLKFCQGKRILNCFAYTGAFAAYALKGGAEYAVNVEASASATKLAKEIMDLNQLKENSQEFIVGDAFNVLRALKEREERFDLIILDPPKFAHAQGKLKSAIRGYKDINLHAMQLLNPGGILFTFSCSGSISLELFSKIITWASMDAKKSVQVVKRLGQPVDHPHLTSFMESEYLKGLICKVY